MLLAAAALPAVVGLALLVATAAGVQVLLRTGLATTFPGPLLSEVRIGLALVLLSGCWLLTSAPLEGRVLLVVSRGHGLALADLVVVPPLLLAAALAVERLA